MLRNSVVKLTRATPKPTTTLQALRAFTNTTLRTAEGDTGATRSGGTASSDAFTTRREASENQFIRQKEMESLRKLKEKLAAQRKHLDELDSHISELEKERGGEQ